MPIAFPLLCAALFYAFLTLVGRAIVGLLCRQEIDRIELRAIAPTVGLSVLTLITTYVIKLGIPLVKVSVTLAVAIAVLSAVLIQMAPGGPQGLKVSNSTFMRYEVPFLAAAILMALPFILGGHQFTVLRGDGSDAFNYVTMADALQRYPLHWIMSQPKEALTSYSPSLPWAQYLLHTRWSTSALLAFVSAAAGVAPIEFEYAFMLALMLVLFSALVAALSAAGTLTKITAWLPVAFVVGFWGQYAVDTASLSQLAAWPIITILIAWLISPSDNTIHFFRYGVVVTSTLCAALFFEYPEIVIGYFAGVSLLFLVRGRVAYRTASSFEAFGRPVLGFLMLALFLTAPLLRFIVGFAHAQTNIATAKTLGWESAYFAWMKNPISGLWGGGADLGLGVKMGDFFTLLSYSVGAALTIAILARAFKIVQNYSQINKHSSEAAALLLAATGFCGAALLLVKGNPWSAGKAMSFFVILIPILLAEWLRCAGSGQRTSIRALLPSKILTLSIFGWITMNAFFAGARVVHAADGTDFHTYISGHGEYRRVNADQIARIPSFDCPRNSRVAVFDPSDWGREYRTYLSEGNGFSVVTAPFVQIRSNAQRFDAVQKSFDCVFADNAYFDSSDVPRNRLGEQVFTVSQGKSFVALAGISGGYGVEMDPITRRRFVFTGDQDIRFTVIGRAQKYDVTLKFCPGAPRPQSEPVSVIVDTTHSRIATFEITECVEKTLTVSGSTDGFVQQIRVSNSDSRSSPTRIGADPRNLRLRVDAVGVALAGHES